MGIADYITHCYLWSGRAWSSALHFSTATGRNSPQTIQRSLTQPAATVGCLSRRQMIFPAVLVEELRVGVADAISGLCRGEAKQDAGVHIENEIVVVGGFRSGEEDEEGVGRVVGDVDFGGQRLSERVSSEIDFEAEAEDDDDDEAAEAMNEIYEAVEKISVEGEIGVMKSMEDTAAKEMKEKIRLANEAGAKEKEEEETVAAGEIRLEGEEVKLPEKVEERTLPNEEEEEEDDDDDDDDDWEGIEQTATGELFGIASAYFGSPIGKEELSRLSRDLQLQVYALSKVAIDGPCYSTQPLSLKPSSRARWHAWRKLGDMSPEQAMERYLTLLCGNFSEWGESRFRVAANSSGSSSATAATVSLEHDKFLFKIKRNEESG